jgi:starch-binding outer membrane protein, SusD/RagB family
MLFKKFRGKNPNLSNDTPILRYAEVLLIFAEAESMAKGGPTAEAYEAINMVRRRAFGKAIKIPFPEVDLPSGMSSVEFRDAVIMERAKELLVEGKRWYDLLRTNTAIEVCKAAGFSAIEEKHLKWVIPQSEIDNNDALTQNDQNPGW